MSKDPKLAAVVAERLVKLRRLTGLTQEAIADAVGTSRSNYTYYEKGTCPPPHMLVRLAAVFNVSVDFLLARELPESSTLRDSSFFAWEDMEQTLSRLKEDELSLLLQYRQLSPEQKNQLLGLVSGFLSEDDLPEE